MLLLLGETSPEDCTVYDWSQSVQSVKVVVPASSGSSRDVEQSSVAGQTASRLSCHAAASGAAVMKRSLMGVSRRVVRNSSTHSLSHTNRFTVTSFVSRLSLTSHHFSVRYHLLYNLPVITQFCLVYSTHQLML